MNNIIIYVIFILLLSNNLCAQHNNPAMNNIGIGLQSVLNSNYATTPSQGLMYGQAATINAYGNYIVNESIADINNERAYHMSLDNQTHRTRVYFEKRQINSYYRDIEEWQKNEKNRLKRSGLYNKENIKYIYDIYKP